MRDWEEFEKLIAEIQRKSAPLASVEHNKRVSGRSGVKRQVDISLVGVIGLEKIFVAVECKRFTRKVSRTHVEAYATKLNDIAANRGVIVSVSGFTHGAILAAKQSNIGLLTYREANEVDWKPIFSGDAWIKFIRYSIDVKGVTLHADNGSVVQVENYHTTFLSCHSGKESIDSILSRYFATIRHAVGDFTLDLVPESDTFSDSGMQVASIHVKGTDRAFLYESFLTFGSGHVLNDAINNRTNFQEVASSAIDWQELMKTQRPKELSPEDYAHLPSGQFRTELPLESTKRFIRLSVTRKAP